MKKKILVKLEHPIKHVVVMGLASDLEEMSESGQVFIFNTEDSIAIAQRSNMRWLHIDAEAVICDLISLLGISFIVSSESDLSDLIQGARKYATRMDKRYKLVAEKLKGTPSMSEGQLRRVSRSLHYHHDASLSFAKLGHSRRGYQRASSRN